MITVGADFDIKFSFPSSVKIYSILVSLFVAMTSSGGDDTATPQICCDTDIRRGGEAWSTKGRWRIAGWKSGGWFGRDG
ncbi:hypothetical protein L484_011992 [Morus notabilis]|uniref:Uncharacterized protein n=1 Tax=Morus notabilis TaxID=981085 RepID=W9RSE5_9ROSA|nr:hypothetical protein L484_011992 [Morus notabilis]